MASPCSDRTGILVVRLWIEADARNGLRARITRTLDSTDTEQTTTAAATTEDVCATVRAWVDAFVASQGTVAGPAPLG